nr:sensor domain-containing diguanylate cyclase [Azospirillum sp. SYSU D00513]
MKSIIRGICRLPGRLGLRARLFLLVIATLLPLFGLVLSLVESMRQDEVSAVVSRALLLARQGARTQAGILREARGLLETLSFVPAVRSTDPDSCTDFLAKTLPMHPFLTGLSVVAPDGRIVCDDLGPSRVDIADRSYFQRASSTKVFTVSDYILGRTSGKAVRVALLPVLDPSRNIRFHMLGGIDLIWVQQLAQEAALETEGDILILDGKGTLLASEPRNDGVTLGRSYRPHPLVQAMMSRTEGVFDGEGLDGQERITAFASLGTEDPVIAVSFRRDQILAAIDQRWRVSLAVLGLVFIGSIVGGWLLVELSVLRVVKNLQAAADRMTRGEMTGEGAVERPAGPLGALALSIQEMGQALGSLAHKDRLTGLPNRLQLERVFDAKLRNAEREPDCALLFIDLDGFKSINDSLGHLAGDAALRHVAKRLLSAVRERDMVVRLGGDEFVVLINEPERAGPDFPEMVAQRILAALREPMTWSGRRITVGCSIGIARPTEGCRSLDDVLRRADEAMYAAKQAGKGRFVQHSELAGPSA